MVFEHNLNATAQRFATLYELSQDPRWQEQVEPLYEYMYFPEDDVVQTVDAVNR